MIAKAYHFGAGDFLLVALAAAVILLSTRPQPDRQLLQLRDRHGQWQSYSLAIDDSRLATLRSQSQRQHHRDVETIRATAKWRSELAAIYADQTRPNESPTSERVLVMPASYRGPEHPAPPSASTLEAEHQFWRRVQRQADADRSQAESKLARLEALAEQQVRFGRVIDGGFSGKSLLLAAAISLCIALGFAIASRLIGSHPVGAVARRTAYATIVFAALYSATV